ncbi:alpha/beta fold hydrolase [Jeotgalibacillus sp. S-D1]|uniref:alpha/beta fold hydrolase n=1 Tax=Jeotgalibacillus sp. S-D1 TaxID=2552189 RepID=UPI00105A007C|nr:alpha/beta fold hydrolase [Jeotgalibacillus sp. S-D1]TDL31951.1 alpha/beta fold hydrolase [Jeotgalibacillus sp. S-D1]
MKKISLTFTTFMTALIVLGACTNTSAEEEETEDNQTIEKISPTNTSGSSDAGAGGEDSVTLKEMDNFYVGDSQDTQSLIHSFIPHESANTPVVMVPGLGLGANIYESTPDHRNGWAYYFAQAGYPVYTVDTSDLASAGLSESESSTSMSKWDSQSIWQRWGLGSASDEPYPDGQFPADSFEQFYASIPMQISTGGGSDSTGNSENVRGGKGQDAGGGGTSRVNPQEVDNMISLLEDKGPALLMVHSMGGEIGYEVARQRPDLVKGLIAIEPVGSPTDEEEVEDTFAEIPYLAVYGDYLESRNQVSRLEAVQTTVDMINENGGTGEVLELTEEGINGNSHLLMVDKNNHEISSQIIDWLDRVEIESGFK